MENRDRFLAAHMGSGYQMMITFRMLDVIYKHQIGEDGLWNRYENIIEELSNGILNGELNRYNLSDEYMLSHHGLQECIDTHLICDIAFYAAGQKSMHSERGLTMDFLTEVDKNMDSSFYLGLTPDKELLTDMVRALEGKANKVVSMSRDMECSKETFLHFCEGLDKEKDEDVIISKINQFNDGSYVDVAPGVNVLASLLKRQECWYEYYLLLENMQYFPIQGALIKGLTNVADVFSVINQVSINKGGKSIQYLLREQFFKTFCEEESILRQKMEESLITEEDKMYINGLLDTFEKEKISTIKSVIDIWLKDFGKEEIIVWMSRKKEDAQLKHKKYGDSELAALKLMSDNFTLSLDEIKGFDFQNMDLAALLYIAKYTKDADICNALISAIRNSIFAENFYPSTTITKHWIEQLRTIYNCLLSSKQDGLSLLYDNRKPLEGFNVDLCNALRTIQQEAYWLAMLILSLEAVPDEQMFDIYVDLLFKDTIYSIDSLKDDVFTPYYIAELMVTQIMASRKEDFEMRLIKEIPYLVFIMRVLSANDGVISDNVRTLLVERIHNDWDTERTLLSQYKNNNLDFYDNLINKYSI